MGLVSAKFALRTLALYSLGMDKLTSMHPGLLALTGAARMFIDNARAERTKDAYTRQWKGFIAWCQAHEAPFLPTTPEVLALYLTARAERGLKPSSLELALAAIAEAHKMAGFPSPRTTPLVRETLRGIKRVLGTVQIGRAPLLPAQMRAMIEAQPPGTLLGARNRALLLLGFLGGFRRSELVRVTVRDLMFKTEGLVVNLFGSKDDRALTGRQVPIPRNPPPLCAVQALEDWLCLASITEGAVFRAVNRHAQVGGPLTGRDLARLVKNAAKRAGIEPANISGHSLRAGFVTAAHMNGAPLESIMKVTGHKSYDTTMRYIRKADLFKQHPSLGLL